MVVLLESDSSLLKVSLQGVCWAVGTYFVNMSAGLSLVCILISRT